MTAHDYLCGVLISQAMRDHHLSVIQSLREQVETNLRERLSRNHFTGRAR